MKNLFSFILVTTCLSVQTQAQTTSTSGYPRIGTPIANHTFTDLVNFGEKKTVSLSDFKGKWLILDMWGLGCSACVQSFPKMNEIHKRFRDRVQLIMIGDYYWKLESHIKKFYEFVDMRMDLEFPVAYDSLFRVKYNVPSFPHIIVADPDGIVRYITQSVTIEDIENLLLNKEAEIVQLREQPDVEQEDGQIVFNPKIPYLTNGVAANGGIDTNFIFRSILSKSDSKSPGSRDNLIDLSLIPDSKLKHSLTINHPSTIGTFNCFRRSVSELYKIAYTGLPFWGNATDPLESNFYGVIYPKLILEIKDSSLFQPDWVNYRNVFNYSLTVPQSKADASCMRGIMQNDLKNYFGYEVRVETRRMPVYRLVVIDENKVKKLRSTGGKTIYGDPISNPKPDARTYIGLYQGRWAKNVPLSSIAFFPVEAISKKEHTGWAEIPPIIDETNIDYNIDYVLNAYEFDFEEIRKAFREIGLDYVEGKKEMQVIVISDPEERR